MTVSSNSDRATFLGNGATTVFSLPFRFFENSNIQAWLITNATGILTPQVLGTHYTLAGAGSPEVDGNPVSALTMLIAPSALQSLFVLRVIPVTQPTDIVNQGRFFPEIHENVFDRLTMISQQSAGSLSRALRVADSDPEPGQLPPAVIRNGKLLSFDSLGNPIAVAAQSGSATDLQLLLADFSDPSKGAAMIGRGAQVSSSIAGLRTLLKTAPSKVAFVTGYYVAGDGGGGAYWLDVADVTSADNGGTIIVAADGGRWKLVFTSVVTVKQFGAKGDGVTDDTARLQAARDWLATATFKPKLSFPAGRYLYSISPNWAIDHAEIVADGIVYLRNTGTGHSVIIDGGAVSGGVFGLRMGWGNKFIVEGSAGSKDGVYGRSLLQGTKIGFQINGAGTTYSGMRVEFAVCAEIDVTCSNNTQGFTWYSRPTNGLFLTRRGSGELCSYCYFPNPILEGTSGTGVTLDWAQGNIFDGGTFEGIASVGALFTANTIKNKIIGTDFEVNTDHDIYCLGRGNEFIACNTEKVITLDGAAVINKVLGGSHSKITATAATVNNLVSGATYNQNSDGSTITDSSGGKLRLRDNYNQGLGRLENAPPASPISIGVGVSPFTYTNLSVNDVAVSVSSGTITSIQVRRNGINIASGLTAGLFELTSQDALVITYSAGLPVMTLFTR